MRAQGAGRERRAKERNGRQKRAGGERPWGEGREVSL